MKTSLCMALTAFSICLGARAAGNADPGAGRSNTVSIAVDDVNLLQFVKLIGHLVDCEIAYNARDLSGNVSVKADSRPWKPLLREVLGTRGLLLIESPTDAGVHLIVRKGDPGVAARYNAAQNAVTTVDSVLRELKAGNTAKALEILESCREENRRLIDAVVAALPPGEAPPDSSCMRISVRPSTRSIPSGTSSTGSWAEAEQALLVQEGPEPSIGPAVTAGDVISLERAGFKYRWRVQSISKESGLRLTRLDSSAIGATRAENTLTVLPESAGTHDVAPMPERTAEPTDHR